MKKTIIAAFVVALFAVGCSGNSRTTASRPVDANANPDVVVRNAVETRAALSSLTGSGVMRIVDRPNNFGLTVNADVVADNSQRLRIRADKLAGTIQAFDVVMLGDDIGFHVPTQRALYYGKVADLRNFSFGFDPDEVLRQMLSPDTALLLRKWRPAQPLRGESRDVVAYEDEAQGNRPPRIRVTVSKTTGMITSVAHLDPRGEPVMVKRYEDYRDLDRGRKTRRGDESPAFPYLIAFNWPRDGRSMEMHFKRVEGNAVVLDEDFNLAASSDTQYLPLQQARLDPGLADEPVAQTPPQRPAPGRGGRRM